MKLKDLKKVWNFTPRRERHKLRQSLGSMDPNPNTLIADEPKAHRN